MNRKRVSMVNGPNHLPYLSAIKRKAIKRVWTSARRQKSMKPQSLKAARHAQ